MSDKSLYALRTLFNHDEEVCVSPDKYGYKSIPISQLVSSKNIKLTSNSDKVTKEISVDDIQLISINPVKGPRRDENVTAFRTFLIELDDMDLPSQLRYVKDELGVPYSLCVFSGNKSLHFAITLNQDLPNIETWKYINQWILNIVEKSDQQLKNPTRGIRYPENTRKDGKKLKQSIIEINGRIDLDTLNIWLSKYEDKKPKLNDIVSTKSIPDSLFYNNMNIPTLLNMPKVFDEMLVKLKEGIQENRNSSWFFLSHLMFDRGFSYDEVVSYLDQYFVEEKDFKRSEWITCIKSAYKDTLRKKGGML